MYYRIGYRSCLLSFTVKVKKIQICFFQLHFSNMDGKMFTGKIFNNSSRTHRRPLCHGNFGRKMRIFRSRYSRILYWTNKSMQQPGERNCFDSWRQGWWADLDAWDRHQEICQGLPMDYVTSNHVNRRETFRYKGKINFNPYR